MVHASVHDMVYAVPYEVWLAERDRGIERVRRARQAQDQPVHAKAARLTARLREDLRDEDMSPAAIRRTQRLKAEVEAAWEEVRQLDVLRDALGRPLDPSPDGRRAWETAFAVVAGVPAVYPLEQEWPPDHLAGLHSDRSSRSYDGDLLTCGACMEDEDWADEQTGVLRYWGRLGMLLTDAQRAWLRQHSEPDGEDWSDAQTQVLRYLHLQLVHAWERQQGAAS